MNLYPNGIIVQEISRATGFATNFNYTGVNAYYQNPLSGNNSTECKQLHDEVSFRLNSDGSYTPIEFISNLHLATRYITQCHLLNIKTRVLFVESEYTDEIWNDPLPNLQFLGYEYSPIPLDSQVLTDLGWYQPLYHFVSLLNSNGLFKTLEDVSAFKTEYDYAIVNNDIGDDTKPYICRVSEVSLA